MKDINDVLVIGAGAAGLFAAHLIASKGKQVTIFEQNKKPARKVQISGGGRCNFTNLHTGPKNFISKNPHFCKSALARFTPWDMVSLVSEFEIEYFEKELGQLFCKKSSNDFINMLLDLCHKSGAELELNIHVQEISKNDTFEVKTNKGIFKAHTIVLATGGLSIPNLGASDFGHRVAKNFGHSIIKLYPALVPLTIKNNPYSELSGVSAHARVSFEKVNFSNNILFTHKGLSGPAILQISSYWKVDESIQIDLIPDIHLIDELTNLKNRGENAKIKKYIYPHLSKRIVDKFFALNNLNDISLQNCSQEFIELVHKMFKSWDVIPDGTEGYRKAEVTCGGVNTDEISSKTMESKLCPGLFLIGEVVDVTGHLGGHNFQWAWASAHACASYFD